MFPIASGAIAGASLTGVFLKFWENGPQLIRAAAEMNSPGNTAAMPGD